MVLLFAASVVGLLSGKILHILAHTPCTLYIYTRMYIYITMWHACKSTTHRTYAHAPREWKNVVPMFCVRVYYFHVLYTCRTTKLPYVQRCMSKCMHTHMRAYIYSYTYVCIYTRIRIHVSCMAARYIYVCVCVCVCVCVRVRVRVKYICLCIGHHS